MTVNPYINNFTQSNEQNLVENLIIECIQMYGIDVYYLPREKVNENQLYGEDILAKFTKYYIVEVYIKTVEGFGGQGDFIKNFGLEIRDQMVLTIAKSRFEDVVKEELIRPREGDLIYFPLSKQMFEIKFVEHESVFYQIGKLYTYDLRVELFEYSSQMIDTGNKEIDTVEDENAYSIVISLGDVVSGTGQYKQGEVVYQGSNLNSASATAKISRHVIADGKATVNFIKGQFLPNVNLVGVTSGTIRGVLGVDEFEMPTQPTADNKEIENADDVIEFSEDNPFSRKF